MDCLTKTRFDRPGMPLVSEGTRQPWGRPGFTGRSMAGVL
jgi:hypothetical protein